MLTWARYLGHIDTNIDLLKSHAVTKLSYARGTTNLASQICRGAPRGPSPAILLQTMNSSLDPNMNIIARFSGQLYRHTTS